MQIMMFCVNINVVVIQQQEMVGFNIEFEYLQVVVVFDDQIGVLEESFFDFVLYLIVYKGEDNVLGDVSELFKEVIEFRFLGDDGNSVDFVGNFEYILDLLGI